jgi:hypothetical protein
MAEAANFQNNVITTHFTACVSACVCKCMCVCVDLFKPTAFCWFVLIFYNLYTQKLDEKYKEST